MAGGSLMVGNFNAGSFVVNLGTSYLLGRLTAQDGPRLDNLNVTGGDYGVPIPWASGEVYRLAGIILCQADIQEHEHTIEDYSEIVGALTGAAQGFMIGGPIGAAVGAVIGAVIGFLTPDQEYYTYTQTKAFLLCDRSDQDPIEGVQKIIANGATIFAGGAAVVAEDFDADGRLIYRKYGKNRFMESTTVYCGHLEQPVDPILSSEVGEVSAFRPWAVVVLEGLLLDAFDRQFPPIEALTQIKTGETWADTAEAIVARAGIDYLRDISTTVLTGRLNKGFAVTGESSCFDAIKPWLPAFGVDLGEVAGQLRFYERSQTMRATIAPDDMGAHIYGDSPPEKFMFRRDTDLNLPQELALTFIDPERDYQPNTQTAKRSEGNAASNVTTSVQLVMSASEGATTAELMLWDAWLGRTQGSFTLTGAWAGLSVGLAYGIPVADQVIPYRITRKTRGANGIIEVECLSDETVTYTADVAGSSGTIPEDESELFPDTRLILMDMPILEDAHDDYGFYIVQSGTERYWTRGRIEASSDGTNFATIIDQPVKAVMGDVTGTLAAGTTTGLDDTLDTTAILTVVLEHDGMALNSVTDAALDLNQNFAFVGKDGLGEYLQFKTATKVGFATWQLTNLRRGRRGTDHAIGTHGPNEEFALLGNGGVLRAVYDDTSDWGNLKYFRGVTLHQDADDADVEQFTNTGEGKRPFSPVNVEGSWDGSNNLTGSRLFAGGLGVDDNAEWEVEITNATPVRLITVTAETFNYSAADQTTDGLTPGTVVEGRVRQTSDVNDGRWREFTLYGPLASTADSTIILGDSTLLTADMA
jgi:hypothetical protein